MMKLGTPWAVDGSGQRVDEAGVARRGRAVGVAQRRVSGLVFACRTLILRSRLGGSDLAPSLLLRLLVDALAAGASGPAGEPPARASGRRLPGWRGAGVAVCRVGRAPERLRAVGWSARPGAGLGARRDERAGQLDVLVERRPGGTSTVTGTTWPSASRTLTVSESAAARGHGERGEPAAAQDACRKQDGEEPRLHPCCSRTSLGRFPQEWRRRVRAQAIRDACGEMNAT